MSKTSWLSGTYYSLNYLAFVTFYIFGLLFFIAILSDFAFNNAQIGDDDLIVMIFVIFSLAIHYFINRGHLKFQKTIIPITGCALGFSVSLFYLISNALNLQLQTRFDEPFTMLNSHTQTIYFSLLEFILIPFLLALILYSILQKLFRKSDKVLEWSFALSFLSVLTFVGIGNEFHQYLLQTYQYPITQFSNYFLGIPLMGFAHILFRKSDDNPLLHR